MKKISQWLVDNIGSHEICDDATMRKSFEKETGKKAAWLAHSVAETRRAISGRGLGGSVSDNDNKPVCYGYEIAASLAQVYANGFRSSMSGRGSMFRDCLEAIQQAETVAS